MTRIALVPGCLALLDEYASQIDPVADLRAACEVAVASLGDEVTILGTAQGERVASSLLAKRRTTAGAEESYLVAGNGSACRSEKAPGFLDPRSFDFDADLGAALTTPDAEALRNLDVALAGELWADVTAMGRLADLIERAPQVSVDYADDPYGVHYWVLRWS